MEGVDPGWKMPPELEGEQLPQSSVFDVLQRFAAAHEAIAPSSVR
jgi:cytochrome c-type protein NapC